MAIQTIYSEVITLIEANKDQDLESYGSLRVTGESLNAIENNHCPVITTIIEGRGENNYMLYQS